MISVWIAGVVLILLYCVYLILYGANIFDEKAWMYGLSRKLFESDRSLNRRIKEVIKQRNLEALSKMKSYGED